MSGWLVVLLVLLAALVVVGYQARPHRTAAPAIRKRATFPRLCPRGDHAWVRRGRHTGCSRCGAIR